ncbi:MAG: GIY-YIG nuclease family protein [Myxococcales bacterium]|jgi:putative endonuclease
MAAAKKKRPSEQARETPWLVYILRCADDTLYTGATNDLDKRLAAHSSGRGAAYTRTRLPVEVVHCETVGERGAALRRELEIKRLTRAEKLELTRRSKG